MTDIPPRLAKRPRYGPYPIPYTAFIGNDGQPDFKVVNQANIARCLRRNLCGLCGEPLEPIIAFIGGPECIKHRTFIDPAMHRDCAHYAAVTCPYLADPNHGYADRDPKHLNDDQTVIKIHEQVNPVRPARLAIAYSTGFTMVFSNGTWMAQSKPFIKIDWTTIPSRR